MIGAHTPVALLLHTGARLSFTSFTVHWSTVIGCAALAALYELGARRAAVPRSRRIAFYLALALLLVSLNGPIHDLSDDYLFSAHMVQHLIMALVVAPLLIIGTPDRVLRPLLKGPVTPIARRLTRPIAAFAIFNVVMCAWHLPPLYNLAMRHHDLHIVQHLMFLAASTIMWWPILSPVPELPRLSYPGQMLYLFLMTIPMSIVAVYIAYADGILYPFYASAPRVWHISPMSDQLMGGLIMWIPGGLYFFAVISVVFFQWQRHGGDDVRSAAVAG